MEAKSLRAQKKSNTYSVPSSPIKTFHGPKSPWQATTVAWLSSRRQQSCHLRSIEAANDFGRRASACATRRANRGRVRCQSRVAAWTTFKLASPGTVSELGNLDEAEKILVELVPYFENKKTIAKINESTARVYLATVYIERKRPEEAKKLMLDSIEYLRASKDKDNDVLILAETNMNKLDL